MGGSYVKVCSIQCRQASISRRPRTFWRSLAFATVTALTLAGCQAIPVNAPDSLNENVSYLPWQDNGLQLLPGMELRTYSTSQAPRGKNTRIPTAAQETWILPTNGEVTRADWVRFQHLLSVSMRQDADGLTIHKQLSRIARDLSGDQEFSKRFGDRVVHQAVESMQLVYGKYGNPPEETKTAAYIRNLVCEGSYADFTAFDPLARNRSLATSSSGGEMPASVFLAYKVDGLGDFWAYTGDDWYLQKDVGRFGRRAANEWFDPTVNPVDARQVPDAAIRVQLSPTGSREWAAPCLSLQDVERRTGAKVVAVRRLGRFLDTDDEDLRRKLQGRDGRFTIAFRDFYRLEGANAYYKAPASLKDELLLAHGDMVVLASPPTLSAYRLD